MVRKLTETALAERLPSWGVLILESHHGPEFTMDWRTHTFLKVIYVLQGSGEVEFRDNSLDFATGDVVIVPPGTRNRIVDAPNAATSLYIGCIARSLVRFDPDLLDRLHVEVRRGDGHFANRVAAILRRMVYQQNEPTNNCALAMVSDSMRLLQLIVEHETKPATKQSKQEVHPTRSMRQYIASLPNRFFEETTIDQAANRMGLPRRTFTKQFAEMTGETWLAHIRRLSIEHAQKRLTQSDLPIVSIAFECGYNDLSTFYRQFRSHCGVSPAKFRERDGK